MMKCPHCGKEIEGSQLAVNSLGLILQHTIFVGIPVGILFSLLDKYTSIPLSISDGLSYNLYLLPIPVIGLFYLVYGILYESGKVKGRLLIFK